MTELDPEVEQQLADLTDEDYVALTARVRPPTGDELKELASYALNRYQNADTVPSDGTTSKEHAAGMLRAYSRRPKL